VKIWMAATVLAAIGAAPAAMAAPQPQPIAIATGAAYVHKPSGVTIPATLGGIPRTKAVAWEADQVDEGISFETPDSGELLTVYVFRHVTGDVPLWFDRIGVAIEGRPIYGHLMPLDRNPAFALPGQAKASAMAQAYSTGRGPYRSTGAALAPAGPSWFVSIRLSSKTLDAEALDRQLRTIVTTLGWPTGAQAQPEAVPIGPCKTPLDILERSTPAKAASNDAMTANIMMDSMVALMAGNIAAKAQGVPPSWCRDSQTVAGGAVGLYRANDSHDSYFLAFGDAGRGIAVQPSAAPGGKPPNWSISYIDLRQTRLFASQDRVPPPDQALEIFGQNRSVATSDTWGGSTIQVDMGTAGH
jgi:hypothetical protein